MGSNYPSDGMESEDQRLSSLRNSLISPHPAYMAQQPQGQQQWQGGNHSTSWDSADPQYAYHNQYPYYQQQQQHHQWILGQYAQPGEQEYMAQQGYWGGYEPQGQDGNPDNKMGIVENNGNMREGSQGSEPSNNSVHGRQQSLEHGESAHVRTPPALIDHELQLKRAAAIASLQKRAASATASGHEDTPSRGNSGTPPTKAKEGKPSGTQRSLFQPCDNNKPKGEPLSMELSSPVENSLESRIRQPSAADNIRLDNLNTPSKQPARSQKQDGMEARRVSMPRKASSTDIDGLLAEGRAAAEASQRTKTVTNGDKKGLGSPKLATQPKEGSGKKPEAEVRPHRRSSLATAVPSDIPEPGEIRDEPEKQRMASQSKLETPNSASSKKENEPGTRKSQSYRPSNCLTKNPTTKADTPFDDKSSKQSTNQVEKYEKCSVSKLEPHSAEKAKKPQSRPDRQMHEPPQNVSKSKASHQCSGETKGNKRDGVTETVHGSNTKPVSRDIQKPDSEEAKLDPNNVFAHLDPIEVEELKEWLMATGYYDEDFRRKTMRRHKRLVALEKEKAELLKEEQEERGALALARTSSFMSPDAPSIPGTPSLSYLASMPPPKSVHKNEEGSGSSKKGSGSTHAVGSGSPIEDPRASRAPLKRRLSVSAGRKDDLKPAEKLAKTGYDNDSPHTRDNRQDRNHESPDSRRPRDFEERREGSMRLIKDRPLVDGMNEERREALSCRRSSGSRSPDSGWGEKDGETKFPRESNKLRREWSDTSEYRGSEPFSGRGRGRGRFHRGSYRGAANFKPHRAENKARGDDLELHLGNVEYFVVKSWTYENVEISQREGTWATQAKNVEKLSEAYEKCRHVILVFSVNNSKAFQGYARMESLPGAPGVRTPSWAEELVWEPSPPFKIRWIAINETKFRYVGHLKNSYNEDAPVLIGRDGQEIEPECGRSLCEIIKDEDPNKQANRPWTKPHLPMSYKTW
ncbi:hypothetical protein FQN54_001084 [Arachnomyces sp. PD_36]|nr:hypothetical protein FQN54_001084 [Arachnomyces sp. PD_36]